MDSWSLKGKKEIPMWNDDGIDWELINDWKHGWYDDNDIKTLRQKLIEDMTEAWRKLCGRDDKMKYMFIKAWRESINLRFGVDK